MFFTRYYFFSDAAGFMLAINLFALNYAEIHLFELAEAKKTESVNRLLRSKAEWLSAFNKVQVENPIFGTVKIENSL